MEKGLSHIISVILVLLIAISLTTLAIIWLPKIVFKPYPEESFNISYIRSRACLSLDDVNTTGKTLTIKNCGKVNLTDFNFYVDGKNINVYLGSLNPQNSVTISYIENLAIGNHDFYVTANYAESPILEKYYKGP